MGCPICDASPVTPTEPPPIPCGWTDRGAIRSSKPFVRKVTRGDDTGGEFILKISADPDQRRKAARRFQVEFEVMAALEGIDGVIPVVDRGELGNRPWFVMPRAMEVRKHLGSRPHLRDVVKVVAAVADTLARVATDQDVAHRDLKPANLLWLNAPLVADFGIAQLPTRAGITQKGESVGPREFLAPEMRYVVSDVDGKAADVWSLAKTLFVLARVNDEKWPPVGTLTAGRPEFSLRPAGGRAAADLEFLLEAATAYRPGRRPSMRTFAYELRAWLDIYPEGTALRPAPLKPSRARVRRFDDPEAQADAALWRRRSDELRRRVRQTMNTIAPSAVKEENAAGQLLDEHGHDEYSHNDLYVAASTVSDAGLRVVLAGFILDNSDIQYIAEVQQRTNQGSFTLAQYYVSSGVLEMPTGLAAIQKMKVELQRVVTGHVFPPPS
jgi:serine/threonine protein kinase